MSNQSMACDSSKVRLIVAALLGACLLAGCQQDPAPVAAGQAEQPATDPATGGKPPTTGPAAGGKPPIKSKPTPSAAALEEDRGGGQAPSPKRTAAPVKPKTATGSRLPAELVGRWQGGADDAFWYTFTKSGTFTMRNSRTGVTASGVVVLKGSRLTLLKPSGATFIGARTWRVESMTLYGEPVHLLYLDGESYAKDEYYQP